MSQQSKSSARGAVKLRSRLMDREPKMYKVVVHNDDVTTFEFVIQLMTEIFGKSPEEATALTFRIHCSGKAVVGEYVYDQAHSLKDEADRMARAEGFPLKITVEE